MLPTILAIVLAAIIIGLLLVFFRHRARDSWRSESFRIVTIAFAPAALTAICLAISPISERVWALSRWRLSFLVLLFYIPYSLLARRIIGPKRTNVVWLVGIAILMFLLTLRGS